MITRYSHKNTQWIDLFSPTSDEIQNIEKEFNIHPLVGRELATPTLKPRVDLYPDYIYLILHFPTVQEPNMPQKIKEVDFIIGKNFIISTRYDDVSAIHKFSKLFEVNAILDRGDLGSHAGYVFFYMIRELYQSLLDELETIEGSLNRIQDSIFRGEEREMVKALSNESRKVLHFGRATAMHREVLESFEVAGKKFFGEDFGYHLRNIIGEYYRVESGILGNRATLLELRETNNSLLSTKQNETMKVLTIMAFVTFPLSLIATIFGMNTEFMPIVGLQNDFWLVIGIMAALTLSFFIFFKYKKWL